MGTSAVMSASQPFRIVGYQWISGPKAPILVGAVGSLKQSYERVQFSIPRWSQPGEPYLSLRAIYLPTSACISHFFLSRTDRDQDLTPRRGLRVRGVG
jgi:hypothetical protein